MSKIVVIGSANIDTIHEVDELPTELTKESVNGIKSTDRALGGKGANQAVSAVLQSEGTENEVYLVGNTNAGKSSLINAIIKACNK